jgi:N-acetylglucosaminyldiphosphoundecaprenol N-acetyl-beta-D-mannosaminyltransferase
MNTNINKVVLFDVEIDNLTMSETLEIIKKTIEEEKQIHHTVINAGKVVSMQKDPELRQSVINADLINADGMGIVWASKILRKPLKERVTGIDVMENLVALSFKNNWKIFLLGAKQEVVKKVAEIYSEKYSPNIIAGYRNGYFTKDEETIIAKNIAESGANLLFVAITSPKKENFLYQHRKTLKKVNFTMGVGGSFDVVSGLVNRAPLWMQNSGLEWFYRFIQEPKRMWKRYLIGNAKFLILTIKELFK